MRPMSRPVAFAVAFTTVLAACGGESFDAVPAADAPDAGADGADGGPPLGQLDGGASLDAGPILPADFRGVYAVSVIARQNGCGFANWEEGKVHQNVGFTLTQQEDKVTGSIDGLVGTAVSWWLGSNSFVGSARGDRLTLTAYGTKQQEQRGSCAWTINAIIDGKLTGDALQGTIKYTAQTNKSPDCGALEGCITQQDFVGSRPPK
jgi:hypothetical protein